MYSELTKYALQTGVNTQKHVCYTQTHIHTHSHTGKRTELVYRN